MWFGRPRAARTQDFLQEIKDLQKTLLRIIAPKPLVRHVSRGENSSESALGHLGAIENSYKSALGQLGRGDRSRLGGLGRVKSMKTSK